MPPRPGLVGATGDPVRSSWTLEEAMPYAVAVGAGQDDPAREPAFTTQLHVALQTA